MWKNWVLDVTHGHDDLAFCPIEDDGSIITGMTILSCKCPGKLVGIFHEEGDDAVRLWMKENASVLAELREAMVPA